MIALIDYGMGNLLSVSKALQAVGASIEITDSVSALSSADAIILPGVGNFGDGMENLNSRGLSKKILQELAKEKPLLGICLGMQMLLDESEEAPGVKGLGVFSGKVKLFPDNPGVKVPHMGWKQFADCSEHRIPERCQRRLLFYFVHFLRPVAEESTLPQPVNTTGLKFAAAIGNRNIFATQFHPKKSQDPGSENF
jgi:glutamine amidotransferase